MEGLAVASSRDAQGMSKESAHVNARLRRVKASLKSRIDQWPTNLPGVLKDVVDNGKMGQLGELAQESGHAANNVYDLSIASFRKIQEAVVHTQKAAGDAQG